jgi:Leucine-rich repeat (LRR) protein
MPRIAVFDVAYCQLTGSIPTAIGDAKSITFLDAKSNKFNGTLPGELFTIPSLRFLDLAINFFTGTLSSDFGDNQGMTQLSVEDNLLSGPLPDFGSDLDVLPSLTVLNIDRNAFTGTLPVWVTGHVTREEITVSGNQFTGTIAATPAGGLQGVLGIDPSDVKLKLMDFSDNLLTGAVPLFGGFIQSLEVMRFSHNQLSGAFPFTAGGGLWVSLRAFEASHNLITGSITSIPPNLEVLDVSNNFMIGDLPEALCDSNSLESLKLSHNEGISGSVSSFLACGQQLKVFEASHCQLTGSLPSTFSSRLEILAIANNTVTGTLPAVLGSLGKLVNLTVASNSMTGFIPPELGEADDLQQLDLRDNGFWGTIPVSFSQLTDLSHFAVSGNQLQGTVPVCEAMAVTISTPLVGCTLECSCCVGPCDGDETEKENLFVN